MSQSAKQGTILLTAAQAWHALSSYVIFVTAARMLGEERFGDFGLVAWTMTTLETLVIAGVPRSVSYYIARTADAAGIIAVRGLKVTLAMAAALTVLLVAATPLIVTLWRDPAAAWALRISAADFVAFAGFAVLVQAVNGLHLFRRQAAIWMIYSTAKVVAVVGLLYVGGSVEWGILGYVIASAVGSLVAVVGSVGPLRRGRERPDTPTTPDGRALLRFGLPVAVHAMTLMAFLNADLWAAKWATGDRRVAGGYVAASTLARVLYFVFVAFGEALFPAVARQLQQDRPDRALAQTRHGMALLVCLLLPAVGVATGAAAPALGAVYGQSVDATGMGFREAAPFLVLLAPTAAALTLVAVLAAVIAAAGQAARMAQLLVGLLALDVLSVFVCASQWGATGAAAGALASSLIGLIATGLWTRRLFGTSLIPARAAIGAVVVAALLHVALDAWSPQGWWIFPYGGVLYALGFGVLAAVRSLPRV